MNGARFPHGDAEVVRLRTILMDIDRALSLLPPSEADGVAATDQLRRSWAQLVEVLALGPAPETRECPICGHTGMRAATRCGNCWNKLSPLAAAGGAPLAQAASPPSTGEEG